MSIDKLEIAIVKDSDQKDAELESMNLEVVEAFSILIQSLTKIIQNSPNKANLKVRVSKGSVRATIEGVGITEIRNNYLQVVHKQTSDKTIVEPWRDLQKLIQKNGLTYSSELTVDGQKTIFHQVLREAPIFRIKKRVKPSLKAQIKFFKGELFQLGGKRNDNIHIEIDNENTIIIDCSKQQAENATKFFKQKALISAWLIPGSDKNSYKFCSSYYYEDLPLFTRFENFILDFENSTDELDSLDKLHLECFHYLNQKDYSSFKKFLQLFNDENINLSIIHSILMLTLPFSKVDELKEVISNLNSIIDKKLKKINRKPVIAIENSN
ncbi:hypothetical protein SAMN05216490_2218 [Mucilaginibacter mallensis]|uniref:Uncharacterized protein n=1 Tax=Mucilaginibacter mallensis TaxID=652787 RepID=A0A1H1WM98_MUCMA|nr:hypothetical protein [Mucilaginibacter mallensis]SDS97741.1 hypothetical protein SAMN05216490_2218 [Mucilaginibacter mallensis]